MMPDDARKTLFVGKIPNKGTFWQINLRLTYELRKTQVAAINTSSS